MSATERLAEALRRLVNTFPIPVDGVQQADRASLRLSLFTAREVLAAWEAERAAPAEPVAWQKPAENLVRWLHCMSYNESYFGEPAGYLKQCVNELRHLLPRNDPKAAPQQPGPPCGTVNNGIACKTPRWRGERLCPDCNPNPSAAEKPGHVPESGFGKLSEIEACPHCGGPIDAQQRQQAQEGGNALV